MSQRIESTSCAKLTVSPFLVPIVDPQLGSLPILAPLIAIRRPFYEQKYLCDAFVFPWDPGMEPEAIEAFERSIGKRCHVMGCVALTPIRSWVDAFDRSQFPAEVWEGAKSVAKPEDYEVGDWLDRQAKGSVLYIRLDSLASWGSELSGVL